MKWTYCTFTYLEHDVVILHVVSGTARGIGRKYYMVISRLPRPSLTDFETPTFH
jgi:hypothetical protein